MKLTRREFGSMTLASLGLGLYPTTLLIAGQIGATPINGP